MSIKHILAAFEANLGNSNQKLVLLKLADNSNDQGVCWPSYDTLAKHTNLSRRSVMRAIAEMEKKGILSIQKRKKSEKENYSNIYQLHICSDTQSPPSARQSPPPSDTQSPKPVSIEPVKETIDVFLLEKITEHWNKYMTGISPKVDLTKNNEINKARHQLIKKIISQDWKTEEYQTDYHDHEYWEGYIQRLAESPRYQWHREKGQLKFDQAFNFKKFTARLEEMRMDE